MKNLNSLSTFSIWCTFIINLLSCSLLSTSLNCSSLSISFSSSVSIFFDAFVSRSTAGRLRSADNNSVYDWVLGAFEFNSCGVLGCEFALCFFFERERVHLLGSRTGLFDGTPHGLNSLVKTCTNVTPW